MTDPVRIGFALVALLAFTVQTAVGFASTLICVTLGAQFMPIRSVVALAVLLSFFQTLYVVVRHHEGVRWRMLATRILPLMLAGTLVGYLVVRGITGRWIELAFAGLVVVLAARELYRLLRDTGEGAPIARLASHAVVLLAGVVHGAYATGGPLLVYGVGRELPKREMRATLSVVWLVLDTGLAVGFFFDGAYTLASLAPLTYVPLALPLGVILGELVHRKVEERTFKIGLFALLFIAGLALMLKA